MGEWSDWMTGCDDNGLQTRTRVILDDPYDCDDWCPETIDYRTCDYSEDTYDYAPPEETGEVYVDGQVVALEAKAF